MGRIRLLPDTVINQIAAGEVVERPASVVKELVENALDAQAESVTVRLEAGGRELIFVEDDGIGMDPDDAMLALERHATSKIASASDLERLTTLGFRGEALPSIASVSELTLETAASPGEGTRVRVSFGRILGQEPCPRPRGTRVTVEKLFARTPARRKFLRSEATELRYTVELLQGFAFAYPEVAFTLWHGQRKLWHFTPVKTAGERLFQILGQTPPPPVTARRGDLELAAFLLPPTPAKHLVVAVNRRLVRDRLLTGTLARLLRSVKGEWQADAFLLLKVPPHEVDFNVHPTKAELRFANPGAVVGFLAETLVAALASARGPEPIQVTLPSAPTPSHQQSLAFRVSEASAKPDLSGPAAPLAAPTTPWGRYLGQYRNTYLLVEDAEGLKLVDQHVAHERVLFEALLGHLGPQGRQPLLIPEVIQVSPALYALASEHVTELARLGVELEPLSGNSLRVTALPQAVPATRAQELVFGLLEDLLQDSLPGRSVQEKTAASLACRAAIKKNTPLAPLQAERLLADLARCRDPHRCPHGRPIVLTVPHDEIERRIGRRG
ncbi:MAG: DNA mismatch repair endonuclease MutL [Thermoanaerobaculum sp.]